MGGRASAGSAGDTWSLVLIETSGNQAYIFDSNRLRQNVGASELVFRAGTQYVLEAVQEAGGPELWDPDTRGRATRLCDPSVNVPLEDGGIVEVVTSTSGRALLLCSSREKSEAIVCTVTRRALREAPGLDVRGAVVDLDWGRETVHEAARTVVQALHDAQAALPRPSDRYLRLPIVADCRTTSLPAERIGRPTRNEEPQEQSAVAGAKYEAAEDGFDRFRRLFGDEVYLPRSIERLQELFDADSVAVVHADGNGIGLVFAGLGELWPDNREYVQKLRAFSLALEKAAERALISAAIEIARPGERHRLEVPLIPLVAAGDDLTVLCLGREGVRFAESYLREFERETEEPAQMVGLERFSACAGIAIAKAHYPFHAAYGLAEGLLHGAKVVKKQAVTFGTSTPSALDFHVLQGSSGAELAGIRPRARSAVQAARGPARVARDLRCALWGGPYIVTEGVIGDWFEKRMLSRLRERAEAAAPALEERGEQRIPASILHRLRGALFEGENLADSNLKQLLPLHELLRIFLEGDESLYREADPEAGFERQTTFLDALDLAGLERRT